MSLYISTSRSITLFALLLDTKDRRLYSGSKNLGIYYTEWFQLNNQVLMNGSMLGRVVGVSILPMKDHASDILLHNSGFSYYVRYVIHLLWNEFKMLTVP